jgi:hypothetical protein
MSASCQSLTSQLIKVAGDFVDKYQDFRKSAAKVFVDTIIPGKPDSGQALDKLIDQAFDLQTDLLKTYGKLTGEGSGKIGARDLQIPTRKVTGSLILTERTFIIAPSPFDKVTLTIKKTDGKAGADIAVCARYNNGNPFDTVQKNIDNGKDSIGKEVKVVLDGMAEKITTIHLVHKGFPTDKMDYTITVEGSFSESAMKELAGKSAVAAH